MLTGTDKGGSRVSDLDYPRLRLEISPSASYTVSSAGAGCTLTYATVATGTYSLGKIQFGYDADPTGGLIRVRSISGTTYWQIPVTKGGGGEVDLSHLTMPYGTGMTVSMTGGGGAILAYLNAKPVLEY
jgi:hypothetical protein